MNKSMFTYKNYKSILNEIKKLHKTFQFQKLKEVKKGFFIRHDVDFYLEPALEMSRIENDFNIQSTYFILMSSNTYNPLSSHNKSIIKKINSKNTEIGLHFDLSHYLSHSSSEISNVIKNYSNSLEDIISEKIFSISLHNPSIYNKYPKFRNFNNAYDSKYFNKNNYLSDSRMNFTKNPFDFINQENDLLQLLIHPFHYSSNGEKYPFFLKNYYKKTFNVIHSDLLKNSEYKKRALNYNKLSNYFCDKK